MSNHVCNRSQTKEVQTDFLKIRETLQIHFMHNLCVSVISL